MIHHLAVHHEVRRMGIARLLLNEVEARLKAKGCKKVLMIVLSDNQLAMQLYKKQGWRHLEEDLVFAKEF